MSFIGDSFGKLSKTGLGDLLFSRPGSSDRTMPSQVVLSSKCFITFRFNEDTEPVKIAEFDQFTKTQRLIERKNFKPYGFTRNISITNHEGWDLLFSGKKTDHKLSYLIDQQELLFAGISNSGINDGRFAANGVRLSFDITELITYMPDDKGIPTLQESYIYKDCSIISYSEDVPQDNQPVTFSIGFFCPKRELSGESTIAKQILENTAFEPPFEKKITNMITDVLRKNK